MIFIGDIHIHPRYADLTLDTLRAYIAQEPNDEHIVFLGDFVYHFSYHRGSLMELFGFFLELVSERKHVYVLAWNHDWLWSHFVYAEAQKIFEAQEHDYLHIITKPQHKSIAGQDVLFVPYMLSRDRYTPSTSVNSLDVQALQDSTNPQEYESYLLNSYLEHQLASYDNLMIVHHYYMARTRFPGIKATFTYRDKAISPHFLEYDNAQFVSWHIHHPFSYKNYLCLGSVRSTSPLETNTLHYLTRYDSTNNKRILTQTEVNPYLVLTNFDQQITSQTLQEFWKELQDRESDIFTSSIFNIERISCELPLDRTQFTLQTNDVDYANIDEYIDPELRQSLRDVKLKANTLNIDQAAQDLVDSSDDFSSSLGSRRELLNKYLDSKFWDQKEKYIEVLKELDIKL